jgi:hypothetical protein
MPRTLLIYRRIVAPVKGFPAGVDFVEARHRHGWEGWGRRFWVRRAPRTQGRRGYFQTAPAVRDYDVSLTRSHVGGLRGASLQGGGSARGSCSPRVRRTPLH